MLKAQLQNNIHTHCTLTIILHKIRRPWGKILAKRVCSFLQALLRHFFLTGSGKVQIQVYTSSEEEYINREQINKDVTVPLTDHRHVGYVVFLPPFNRKLLSYAKRPLLSKFRWRPWRGRFVELKIAKLEGQCLFMLPELETTHVQIHTIIRLQIIVLLGFPHNNTNRFSCCINDLLTCYKLMSMREAKMYF